MIESYLAAATSFFVDYTGGEAPIQRTRKKEKKKNRNTKTKKTGFTGSSNCTPSSTASLYGTCPESAHTEPFPAGPAELSRLRRRTPLIHAPTPFFPSYLDSRPMTHNLPLQPVLPCPGPLRTAAQPPELGLDLGTVGPCISGPKR